MGRLMVEQLEATGLPYTVVELNAQTVADQAERGKPFLFGDVANPAVLESAGVHEASALVLTVPDEEAVLRACAAAHHRRPDLYIAARMHHASRTEAAKQAGATYVLVDELVAAEAMVDAIAQEITRSPALGNPT
jgi:CPA2 family monovalent cation:H+ antiporter-2